MSIGLREDRRRRKRRFHWTLLKWSVVLCLIAAAGTYAYLSGQELARGEVNILKGKIESLEEEVAGLEQKNAVLQTETAAERIRAEEWRERYRREVPTGDKKDLFDLVLQKLSNGVEIDRLKFVIGAVENRETCDEKPVSKRFIVQTPLHKGENASVRFASGAITVTAIGEPARDAFGNPEAWYDSAEPITVRITHIGGKTSEFSGKLPLHPSLVVGDHEYRFSFSGSSRGFVEVSGLRCAYP